MTDPAVNTNTTLRTVALSTIDVAEGFNPRQAFEDADLQRLQSSIERHGILVPLIVAANGDDRYELVDGERRYRAAVALGITEIPVAVRDVDERTAGLEQALIANQARTELNPVEEAQAFQRLIDAGLTRKGVAEELGVSQKLVRERIELVELPDRLRPQVASGQIPPGAIKPLLVLTRIHPGLPEVAVARVTSPPQHDWDEQTTWADLAEDPIGLVCGRYEGDEQELPADVYESGVRHPVARFKLDERAERDLGKLCELLRCDSEAFAIEFGPSAVEAATKLGAAHASSRGWSQIIVGQDVADQLAGDYVRRCLRAQRENARRPAGPDDRERPADAEGGRDEEQVRERRRLEREAEQQSRREAVAYNADLGAAVVKHLAKVQVDERVVKVLAAVDLHGELGQIAARGARYGLPGWVVEGKTKGGKPRVEYADPATCTTKAREFLAAGKAASEIAGRAICLLVMARYAREEAVARSNRAGYELHFATRSWSGAAVGVPWADDVLETLDAIAGERLPERLVTDDREAPDGVGGVGEAA